jgi:septum formation protein
VVNSALLLASNSPRRRQLLTAAGFEFTTAEPQVVEKFDVDLTARELTTLNAFRKGMSIAQAHPGKVILAADTLVALDNEIMGKPANLDEAVDILRRLSGRRHEVYSAVFIWDAIRKRSTSFCVTSHVHFRRLSESAIRAYIDQVNPLDKAGAYAAQGSGREIIQRIEGSYTNVVGLPMEKTVAALAKFRIHPNKIVTR